MNDSELEAYIRGMIADMHLSSQTNPGTLVSSILEARRADPRLRQKIILGYILGGCTEYQEKNGLRQATAVSVKIDEAMG